MCEADNHLTELDSNKYFLPAFETVSAQAEYAVKVCTQMSAFRSTYCSLGTYHNCVPNQKCKSCCLKNKY